MKEREVGFRRRVSEPLLRRILATSDLAAQVQALPAAVLARLIDHIGLEDSGELVALVTTSQLAQIFDEDIWRSGRPGRNEHFDAGRFRLWLSVLLEDGEALVAEKLVGLPEDLVTLALHRQMLVLDGEALIGTADDDEAAAADNVLARFAFEELDRYLLIPRFDDGWDDLFGALLALDREHHDLVLRILARCCQMSGDEIDENGGLQGVLAAAATLEEDVAGEREDRRAEAGYVAPADAAAFLRLARQRGETPRSDPLTRAYFRRRAEPTPIAPVQAPAQRTDLLELLHEAGVVARDESSRPLIAGPSSATPAKESLLVGAMHRLATGEDDRFAACAEEIAYLANVLVAGCSFQGRRLERNEAADAVLATCNLALDLATAGENDLDAAVAVLHEQGAAALFRHGWHRLTATVIHPAAVAAERQLRHAAARTIDVESQHLREAVRRVRTAIAAGTPWTSLAEIDSLLGHAEGETVDALRSLMDECPTLRGGAAGRPRFIATAADLEVARAFLERFAEAEEIPGAKSQVPGRRKS